MADDLRGGRRHLVRGAGLLQRSRRAAADPRPRPAGHGHHRRRVRLRARLLSADARRRGRRRAAGRRHPRLRDHRSARPSPRCAPPTRCRSPPTARPRSTPTPAAPSAGCATASTSTPTRAPSAILFDGVLAPATARCARTPPAGAGHRAQARRRGALPGVSRADLAGLPTSACRTSCASTRCSPTASAASLVGPRGDYRAGCAFPRWDSDACFATLIGGQGTYAVTPLAALRVGRLLRARADLAQPLGHRRRHGRVPRGARVARPPRARRHPAPDPGASRERRAYASCSTHAARSGRERMSRPAPRRRRDAGGPGSANARMTWLGAGDAERAPDGHGGKPLVTVIELRGGREPRLRARARRRRRRRCRPRPRRGLDRHRGRVVTPAARRCRRPRRARDARHAYAVLCRAHQRAAAAWWPPPRCRCPSAPARAATTTTATSGSATSASPARRSPGPARCRCSTTPCASSPSACSPTATGSLPPTPPTGDPVPDERTLDLPGYPGGSRHRRQLGQPPVPARRLRRGPAPARRGGRPRPPRRRRLARRRGRRRRDRAALARARRRHLGTRPRRLDAQPPDLRRRPAAHQRAPVHGDSAAAGWRWPTRSSPTPQPMPLHPAGHWQRSPERRPARRRAAAARHPRRASPRRPPHARHPAAVGRPAHRGRVLLPLPPDERPLGEAEGAFVMCGFLLALAYAQQGDAVRAARWFERNRAACGPAGLLSEEFDVVQRQMRGQPPPGVRARSALPAYPVTGLDLTICPKAR